ncbi:hypothetical protein ACI65C_000851 [Semiaphis heraclei]
MTADACEASVVTVKRITSEASKSSSSESESVPKFTSPRKTFKRVNVDNWKKCTEHCHKLQDDDFIKEGLRDEILAPIILTINPDDSSDSDSDNEDF